MDQKTSSLDVGALLQPELLSEVELREILTKNCVSRNLQNLSRNELVDLFRTVALPLPQRDYGNRNWRERYLTEKQRRHKRTITISDSDIRSREEPLRKLSRLSDEKNSVPVRLKPPPAIDLSKKVIKLSDSSSSKSSSDLDKIVIKRKEKKYLTCDVSKVPSSSEENGKRITLSKTPESSKVVKLKRDSTEIKVKKSEDSNEESSSKKKRQKIVISWSSSPNVSPQSSPRPSSKHHHKRDASTSSTKDFIADQEKPEAASSTPKNSSDQGSGCELSRSNSQEPVKERKSSDRVKKKTPWYSALYPTYKSRSDDFKRIFKDIPSEERLVVDYSCAIQRDILVHGRLYVSQNYLCFYANIFRWETQVTLRWKDVTSLTKEKTALVIPNAILVHTTTEKHFLTSFAARDKAYLMLFRVWQNALMDQPMSTQEMWQWVHTCYGDELGLTSDDDDYIPPITSELTNNNQDDDKSCAVKCDRNSLDSYSEACSESIGAEGEKLAMPLVQPPTPTSTNDHLPTDPSDSSPSESESEKQGGLITCPCLHEGRLMLHMQVSIHVDQLFTHLFTNSKFFFDLHETRKSTDVKQSAWVTNPSTNQKGRTVSLTVQLAQAIGPKCAQVTESQKMLPCSKPGEMYAIDVEACNAGVPYADAFYISTHYCLTRGADPNTSTLAVYCQIKYRKSVWGLVKNYIEKHCWYGLEEYFASLIKALKEECERTRRAMASGIVGGKQKVRRRRKNKPVLLPPPIAEEPLIQPLALPQPPMSQQTDTLAWIVFGVLFLLLVFNAALYYKLWGLEQLERNFDSTEDAYDFLKHEPKTPEDWKVLLQKQEQLHTAEIERWIRVLKASVHLLNQVEISLTKLQAGLHTMLKSNGHPFSMPKPNEPPISQTPHPKPDISKQTSKLEEKVGNQQSFSSDTRSHKPPPPPPPVLKTEL